MTPLTLITKIPSNLIFRVVLIFLLVCILIMPWVDTATSADYCPDYRITYATDGKVTIYRVEKRVVS